MTGPKSLCLALTLGIPLLLALPQTQAQTSAAALLAAAPQSDAEGLIKLDVVVTDKSGKPISGLTPNDFTLLDQGQVAKIISFQGFSATAARPDPPVEVILVLDTLGINSRMATYEQQQIEEFLTHNGGHLSQPVSLFKLTNSGLSTVAQPSTDGTALKAEFAHGKLRKVREFRGLELPGLPELQCLGAIAALERQKPGRKLLIWIGPDWKLTNLPYLQVLPDDQEPFDVVSWFYTLLRESRIALYSFTQPESDSRNAEISTDHPVDEAFADNLPHPNDDAGSARQKGLKNVERNVLAMQSGGRAVDPSKSPAHNLAEQIGHCIEEGSSFYTLSFNPPKTSRRYEYHQLMLHPLNPELTARTSGGYFNQSYFYDQPNPAVKRVTVEQLESLLTAAHDKSDGDTAHRLAGLELTERLSTARLAAWKDRIRGGKSWAALISLADASAFLSLPAAEIPADAAPSIAEQRRIVSLASNYLLQTVPKLPNLFATRTTFSYEEADQDLDLRPFQQRPSHLATEKPGSTGGGTHPLHLADTDKVTVLYRSGTEVVDPGKAKHRTMKPNSVRLTTHGTFGPLAAVVIADAAVAPSKFAWSHWERGTTSGTISGSMAASEKSGTLAVFSFVVAAEKRHYQVQYCCLSEGDGNKPFQKLSGYHGEIVIDPSTGAVMRLAIQADLNPTLPLIRSDILVEYGPVEIGGVSYICPIKSVSISRWRRVKILGEWDLAYRVFGAYATSLNDVVFSDYHIFRSQSRIILDDDSGPAPK